MGFRSHLFTCRSNRAVITTAATIVFIVFLVTGCGDTFRPVANPITTPGGDPAGIGNAIILASNGAASGSSSHINVSGDTVTAVHDVGVNPVHAALLGSEVIVANQGSDNLTAYLVTAAGGTSVTTVSLMTGAQPAFVHSTDSTNVYVAEKGANAVGVIPLSTLAGDSNLLDCSLPPHQAPCHITDLGSTVGPSISAPVAIAQPVGLGKLYVANSGSNKVSVIDVPTLTVKAVINVGANPQAIVASADNSCVYVANQGSNNVTVISTASDAATATPITVGPGPKFLRFDNKLQRVYVANSGGNTISVINHAADCSASTSTPVTVGPNPQSITALSDGTRAYVANSDGSVSVINTSSNTLRKTITAGGSATTVSIGSSTDGAKVFVGNSSGVITVIRTSDDTVVLQLMGATGANKLPGAPNPQFVLMF